MSSMSSSRFASGSVEQRKFGCIKTGDWSNERMLRSQSLMGMVRVELGMGVMVGMGSEGHIRSCRCCISWCREGKSTGTL